jgi:uncharacterized protein (TIGR02145 family)
MRKNYSYNLLCLSLLISLLILIDGCKGPEDIVKDIEGNEYKTVVIGEQVWMAQNLKTATYNNGWNIIQITDNEAWQRINKGAYCWYNDNSSNGSFYGALYNWKAVNTGKLCPKGWRVPSDEDWKHLEGYADSLFGPGSDVWNTKGLRGYDAGKRLKATFGWKLKGVGTDRFGFAALPGGERLAGFNNTWGSSGFWWTSTECDDASAWYRSIVYSFNEISRDCHPKAMGFAVRCIKNK